MVMLRTRNMARRKIAQRRSLDSLMLLRGAMKRSRGTDEPWRATLRATANPLDIPEKFTDINSGLCLNAASGYICIRAS